MVVGLLVLREIGRYALSTPFVYCRLCKIIVCYSHGSTAVEDSLGGSCFCYSWIGCPVRTYKNSICRETERAATDLNIQIKSSRQGASIGGVQKKHIFFFGGSYV